jgi:hypothetical protein
VLVKDNIKKGRKKKRKRLTINPKSRQNESRAKREAKLTPGKETITSKKKKQNVLVKDKRKERKEGKGSP